MSEHDTETSSIEALAEGAAPRRKESTVLVELAKTNNVALTHTEDGEAFATVSVAGKQETWAVASREFRGYLTEKDLASTGSAPGSQVLQDAVNTLEAEARFRGPREQIYIRSAEHLGVVYIDVGDEARTIIAVSAGGYGLVSSAPVKFRRPKGMQALPIPQTGGSVDELREYLNVQDRAQWILLLAWLISAYFPQGPHPLLAFLGPQGAGKTTHSRVARRLTDPNKAAVRAQPRAEEDLIIAALNGMLVVFDNVSNIPDWLSDALCRLATGGGFSKRELYTNFEEMLVHVCRPVILTGIDESVHRSDLLSRTLLIPLTAMHDGERRSEAEFWLSFERASGRMFGSLLASLSGVLRHLPQARAQMHERPRMADFAERGVALEIALGWRRGEFMAAYAANQESASEIAIDSSLMGKLHLRVGRAAEGRSSWLGRI